MRLEFAQAIRRGSASKRQVDFFDYVIDGSRLTERLARAAHHFDYVAPFGWGETDWQRAAARRLSAEMQGDLPSGRVALLVCPECGDLGCGSVGVHVATADDAVVWRGFAYENNYNPDDTTEYANIGPFEFDREQYMEALDSIRRWSI